MNWWFGGIWLVHFMQQIRNLKRNWCQIRYVSTQYSILRLRYWNKTLFREHLWCLHLVLPEFFQMTKSRIGFTDWSFQRNISKNRISSRTRKMLIFTNLIRYSPVIGLIGSAKTWFDSRTRANWDNSDFNISHFSLLSAFIASLFTSFTKYRLRLSLSPQETHVGTKMKHSHDFSTFGLCVGVAMSKCLEQIWKYFSDVV